MLERDDPLETISLLACNTEVISDVLIHYALTGKIIELAVLFVVAREKVLGPVSFQGLDGSNVLVPFRKFVRSELAALIDLESYLVGRGSQEEKLYELCKARKSLILSALPLFQVFEKAGDAIDNYCQSRQSNILEEQVVEDVARHLLEAGFSVMSNSSRLLAMEKRWKQMMAREVSNLRVESDIVGYMELRLFNGCGMKY